VITDGAKRQAGEAQAKVKVEVKVEVKATTLEIGN
jgi:hypothetical protein